MVVVVALANIILAAEVRIIVTSCRVFNLDVDSITGSDCCLALCNDSKHCQADHAR